MTRILTAVVGIPPILAVIYFGPTWLFASLVALVTVLALDEFLMLCQERGLGRPGRWFLGFGVAMTVAFAMGTGWPIAILFVSVFGLSLAPIVTRKGTEALDSIVSGAAGLVYVSVPLGFLIELSRPGEVFLLLAIVWAGDIAAYYVGRTIGSRKLAPVVSPNKTVEGALGGFMGSTIVGITVGGALLDLPASFLAVLGLATGFAAQSGDLAESAFKRSARVKDSSARLPGHGGVLDRVDSLLFATPLYLWLLRL